VLFILCVLSVFQAEALIGGSSLLSWLLAGNWIIIASCHHHHQHTWIGFLWKLSQLSHLVDRIFTESDTTTALCGSDSDRSYQYSWRCLELDVVARGQPGAVTSPQILASWKILFSSENVIPKMQCLGLEIPLLGKFRSKIEILSIHKFVKNLQLSQKIATFPFNVLAVTPQFDS